MGDDDRVSAVRTLQEMPLRENGGYFVLRPEVIDLIPAGGDLIKDAITPLAAEGRIMGYSYDGFWHPADTLKERTALEAAYQSGARPWMLWDDVEERDAAQAAIAGLAASALPR
jgi:glucose-1-phosphate cytidylyltransferase